MSSAYETVHQLISTATEEKYTAPPEASLIIIVRLTTP